VEKSKVVHFVADVLQQQEVLIPGTQNKFLKHVKRTEGLESVFSSIKYVILCSYY